ncbi:hypothetical protein GQ53DRAFT_747536 [Thozetella sp. PMI_491]|nr:hypothetical protein GQ53DRAFT_747536 [Thozetella sp. PMI_491]
MSRAVCRFWQQGNCRNGNSCRFEHPGAAQQNNNRFGPLAGGSSSGNRNDELPYLLSKDALQKDLTEPERPKWILSAFGPGKDAPEQLFGGYPIEQSFEEIRLHYLQGQLSGNPQGALSEIEGLYSQAQQKIQNALNNLDGALRYVVDAGNKHPNRVDICQQNSRPGGTTGEFAVGRQTSTGATAFGSPAFGAPASSQPSTGAFGQPSALGQRSNPFGAPAATSAFGQPSQMGATTSAFGKPAPLGGTTAFGQPSQLGGTSAFGQPSQLGAGTSAFSQPSQLGASSGFGQPSMLGAKASPFGQPAQSSGGFGQPAQSSGGFGQPSSLGQKASPFGGGGTSGTSPFGVPSSGASSNPFGQPSQAPGASPFGQPAQTQSASPFGQPAQPQTSSPFGQPNQPQTASPFGTPATGAGQNTSGTFGQPSTTTAGFGQPSQPSPFGATPNNAGTSAFGGGPNPSPFGAPANSNPTPNAFQQAAPQASPFGGGGGSAPQAQAQGGAQGQGPYAPGASRQHPPIESYASKAPNGRLQMFKGRPVEYRVLKGEEKESPVIRGPNGGMIRVWHPDGAPPYNPDTEAADPSAYNSNQVIQQWMSFAEAGKFVDGLVPEVPPRREFCAWDF